MKNFSLIYQVNKLMELLSLSLLLFLAFYQEYNKKDARNFPRNKYCFFFVVWKETAAHVCVCPLCFLLLWMKCFDALFLWWEWKTKMKNPFQLETCWNQGHCFVVFSVTLKLSSCIICLVTVLLPFLLKPPVQKRWFFMAFLLLPLLSNLNKSLIIIVLNPSIRTEKNIWAVNLKTLVIKMKKLRTLR